MPSRPKQPRRVAKVSRPVADATCTKSRTVRRGSVPLDVWTCSAPRVGEPLEEAPRVSLAPEVVKVGRRNWKFWYVSGAEAKRDDALVREPGWYFSAATPNPEWINNDSVGPYRSFDEALQDLVLGLASGY